MKKKTGIYNIAIKKALTQDTTKDVPKDVQDNNKQTRHRSIIGNIWDTVVDIFIWKEQPVHYEYAPEHKHDRKRKHIPALNTGSEDDIGVFADDLFDGPHF